MGPRKDDPRDQLWYRRKEQGKQGEQSEYATENATMTEATILDRTFQAIMKRMVKTGQAPHYTELAKELGLSTEEGRKTLHDLFSSGIAGWLYPRTDYIVSFAPFSNLPTQYRITIDGQEKWFGQ
jgi:hypothetical protein